MSLLPSTLVMITMSFVSVSVFCLNSLTKCDTFNQAVDVSKPQSTVSASSRHAMIYGGLDGIHEQYQLRRE